MGLSGSGGKKLASAVPFPLDVAGPANFGSEGLLRHACADMSQREHAFGLSSTRALFLGFLNFQLVRSMLTCLVNVWRSLLSRS